MIQLKMHLVRLFKVTGHFRQELVFANADINGKAKFIADSVFDGMSKCNRIRINTVCTAHIQVTFVNAGFFYHRCVLSADIHKLFGIHLIELEIRLGHY